MDQKRLLKIQTERGAKSESFETAVKTIDTVVNECRKRIEEQSALYRDLNPIDKKEVIKRIIADYVMTVKPLVKDYIDSENRPDTLKLVDKLVEAITDYDILTQAMMDENIFEIRSNGKEIKVENRGHVEDLRDKDGNIVSWDSPEQQEIVLRKMLGDIRLTPKDALVNGSTIEGYRIAAVHSSATSLDPNDPGAPLYHSFVLRKFSKVRMSLPDIVAKHTMSDNMARLLALLPAGGLTFLTVGPTASGKSTTNNAILKAVPPYLRTILIQNPSEIDLRMKDASGRVINDVLHLEAKDFENPTPNDPTMANEMNHILRLSPSLVCLGEIRSNEEFQLAMKILLAGHPINSTYHASSSAGAVSRFLTAYLAASSEPSELALSTITSHLDLIIVQRIMRDGFRRVIQISEVTGVDPTNPNKPQINDLYRFEITEDPELDESGNVKLIKGIHRRVGKISQGLVDKLQLEGISSSRYDFLLDDTRPDEVETYTGKNIEHYGMELA